MYQNGNSNQLYQELCILLQVDTSKKGVWLIISNRKLDLFFKIHLISIHKKDLTM